LSVLLLPPECFPLVYSATWAWLPRSVASLPPILHCPHLCLLNYDSGSGFEQNYSTSLGGQQPQSPASSSNHNILSSSPNANESSPANPSLSAPSFRPHRRHWITYPPPPNGPSRTAFITNFHMPRLRVVPRAPHTRSRKQAYEKGIVLVQCPGCKNGEPVSRIAVHKCVNPFYRHLIATICRGLAIPQMAAMSTVKRINTFMHSQCAKRAHRFLHPGHWTKTIPFS